MPFSLTTASSPADVIAQVVAFAVANGFTDRGSVDVTDTNFSPSRVVKLTRISLGSVYWTFIVDPRDRDATPTRLIKMRMSYSIANAYPTSANGQGGWTGMSLWGFGGPYPNLYLYCDGVTPAIHVALEMTNGIFNHMSFGMIEKNESFTGGEYAAAGQYQWRDPSAPFLYPDQTLTTNANSPFAVGMPNPNSNYVSQDLTNGMNYIRVVPAGGATNNMADFAAAGYNRNTQAASLGGFGGIGERLLRDSPNAATLRTPLIPFYVFIWDPVSTLWRIAGRLPGVRLASITVVDPAEVILSDWQCFPYTQKFGSRVSCPNSGKRGIAYKRVS